MPSKLLSLGQLLDNTWAFYSKNFKTLMQITAWLFLATLLFILGTMLSPIGNTQFLIDQGLLTTGHKLGMFLTIFARTIVFVVMYLWVAIGLIRACGDLQTTKSSTAKAITKHAWKRFIPYFFMSLLRVLIFFLPLLALLPGFFLIQASLNASSFGFSGFSILLFLLGALTALVLLVVLWVWFSFAGYSLVLDEKGIIGSLKASKQLVHGRFWGALWRLLFPKVLITFTLIVAQVIIWVIFSSFIVNPNMDPAAFYRLTDIIGNIVVTGLSALSLPLYIIADYYIFDSLKKN